ncbi:uncharacterized protein LOC135841407 [Planococcus citri]|uniref:uncharacterized protein LOC135841407 n=1 Tax=Planococcus citri TaxID=170843 RepID=UPI0031F9425D
MHAYCISKSKRLMEAELIETQINWPIRGRHNSALAIACTEWINAHQREQHPAPLFEKQLHNCPHCKKKFTRKSNLTAHIYALHEKRFVETNVKRNYFTVGKHFSCECGDKFSYRQSLLHHIKSKHLDLHETCYECDYCSAKFEKKSTLRKHVTKHTAKNENVEVLQLNKKSKRRKPSTVVTCVKCGEDFRNEDLLLKHLETHDIIVKNETIPFDNWQAFLKWKDETEEKIFCRFVKRTSKKNKSERVTTYYCERRGSYLPITTRKRRERMIGSKKIHGYCPAKIVVRENTSDKQNNCAKVKAFFCSTHVHPLEPQNLKYSPFNSNIKGEVAKKLAVEIPTQRILKDIRKSSTCSSEHILHKSQLLTRKDVVNIARANNLQFMNRRSTKDFEGVESFTIEHTDSVLLYKKQKEVLEDFPELQSDDFVLIYMNQKQKEKLQKFGNNVICMDGTHGLNKYGFILHTLMILDDYDEGYPACFLFTNRNDFVVIEILFRCLKKEIGLLKPKTFISDMQETYFNAYLHVMNHQPEFHLHCTWHVLKAWKQHLNKIKDAVKHEETKNQLFSLHRCGSISEFEEKLIDFCTIEEPEPEPEAESDIESINSVKDTVAEFKRYFIQTYVPRKEQWAYCYHQHAGVNTNMALENFHGKLKHNFANGMNINHLQDSLAIIENYLEFRLENEAIHDVKGHLSSKIIKLRKSHDKVIENKNDIRLRKISEAENDWIVASFSSNDVQYQVTYLTDCRPDCKLTCEKCNICAHRFKCSCPESSIRSVMCKHIHAVGMQFIEQTVVEENWVNEVENSPVVEENLVHEVQSSVIGWNKEPEIPQDAPSAVKRRTNTDTENRKMFDDIMNVVGASPRKNAFVSQSLKKMRATILAMQSDVHCPSEEKKAAKPKKIVHQREFYATTKKKGRKPKK